MELTIEELATRRIRTRSIVNVATERLHARLGYLRNHAVEMMREAEQKNGVRTVAREALNIERELARRGEIFEPVTDGRHLGVDVHEVRIMMPPPSWAEIRSRQS